MPVQQRDPPRSSSPSAWERDLLAKAELREAAAAELRRLGLGVCEEEVDGALARAELPTAQSRLLRVSSRRSRAPLLSSAVDSERVCMRCRVVCVRGCMRGGCHIITGGDMGGASV